MDDDAPSCCPTTRTSAATCRSTTPATAPRAGARRRGRSSRCPRSSTPSTGPVFGEDAVEPFDADLTRQHAGEPLGERIIVTGRVLDEDGRPLRGALVEVWQANAAGRYRHEVDQHPAPLDPNFTGAGRCLTDDDGALPLRRRSSPAPYPWRNHQNAWRPAHIHFSVFGRAVHASGSSRRCTSRATRCSPYDPIFNSVRDPTARELLVARFDLETTEPEWALGYRWDIVLGRGGCGATPLEGRR